MWFAIALFAVGFIATALLAPKPKIENARPGALSDFNFPRSQEGDPVGLVQGAVKLKSPNTIWTGNFKAVAITKKVKTGMFSSKKQTIGYKYYIGMDLALCLGPNVVLKKIWFGKYLVWEGTLATEGTIVIDKPDLYGGEERQGGIGGTIAFYPGALTQTQDPYLVEQIGDGVPAYNGISHMVFRDFYFGNSTSIQTINVEVQVFNDTLDSAYGLMPNGLDVNPVEGLFDVFTNFWGRLGMDPNLLDIQNMRDNAETLYNEGNGLSIEVARPNKGEDLATEILRQINGILYQDVETAKIKLKLIRRDYVVNELPVLTPKHIKEIKSYTKKLWDETYNQVRIKYTNRDNNYATAAALWQDFANINFQNRVRSTDVSMPGIYESQLANIVAAREGAELNVPLYSMEFDANRTLADMRPGDCFVLQWPEYNVTQMVMRIRKFDVGELADGKITVFAVQDEFAADDVVFADPIPSKWTPPDNEPTDIDYYAVFAVPNYFLRMTELATSPRNLLWALARVPDADSLGYNIQTSLDNWATSYLSASNAQYGGAAVLTANYADTVAFGTGYDSSGTGIVIQDLDGIYEPGTESDAAIRDEGMNLIYMNGEILGYRTVTDLGGGQYRLTNIRRALFDTKMTTHTAGDNVFFLSGADGITETDFGGTETPRVKLQDRSQSGTMPLTDVPSIGPVTINRRSERPAPPTYLRYAGARTGSAARSATGAVAWRERNRNSDTVPFFDDASQTVEAGQDNELKWKINAGAFTTVYVTGDSTTIDTSGASPGDVLTIELRSRRDGLLSIAAEVIVITLS